MDSSDTPVVSIYSRPEDDQNDASSVSSFSTDSTVVDFMDAEIYMERDTRPASGTPWYEDGEVEIDTSPSDHRAVEELVTLPASRPVSRQLRNHRQPSEPWRQRALDFITETNNLFVLEAYMVKEYVLQIAISTEEATLRMNTKPWSIVLGGSMTERELARWKQSANAAAKAVLDKSNKNFSTSRIVRFILENCNGGVPAIVSSSYTKLMDRHRGGKSFLDYIVFDKRLSGSQRCCHSDCRRLASTVHIGEDGTAKGNLIL